MVTAVVANSEGLLDKDVFNDLSEQDDHKDTQTS